MQRTPAEKVRLVRELTTGTHQTVYAHTLRKASTRPTAPGPQPADRRSLVELCTRITETHDQGAEVYAVLVNQPADTRETLTGLLEAHHGDGGPRAVRRAVEDYARLHSPHRTALAELALILEGPSDRYRGRRARR